MRQEGKSCPWQGRDPPPRSTQKHVHLLQFKDLILTNVFCFWGVFLPANLNSERKGQREMLPFSLNQAPQTQMEMRELTSVIILTFHGLLPVFSGSHLQALE